MLVYHLFILVVYLFSTTSSTNEYNTPSENQYHIQTDEGPERYFRYQTLSGQYRKEKRLEDGTVIGTYAWIDDDGILRQRDYIADDAGYRILKSKNVFVGRNVPVGDAVKAVKKYPASAGTLVGHNARPVIRVPTQPITPVTAYLPSTTPSPISSTGGYPYVEISPNAAPSTTPSSLLSSTINNFVDITPSAFPSTTPASVISASSDPSLLLQAPINQTTLGGGYYSTANPIISTYYSTPSPIPATQNGYYSTPSPLPQTTQTPDYDYLQPNPPTYQPSDLYNNYHRQQQPQLINQNSIDYNPYVSHLDNSMVFHNGPTYPIDKHGQDYTGRQKIGNGYDPQYPLYDGVSVTNDGFRYYIPRAYHEEQTQGDKKTGSFGYIDPFGIRRVIYYNTAPGTGFQHRKNNRYVGFQATPYDPRPY